MYIEFNELKKVIKEKFIKYGMSETDADICAQVHAESTYDGVYSHGVNRVARFINYVEKGWIDLDAKPSLEKQIGSIEIYNGNLGPGILNANFICDRGIELAKENGISLIAINNTTHWMRGGTYGLRAAKKGFMSIMWTNTEACMPVWGSTECRLGNNPFVISIPRSNKSPLLLDMAMSQYSYGKLEVTRQSGKKLPFPGGFNINGELTSNPEEIEKSRRILPIGYWKGSGLAFMLDILAGILSNGNTVKDLSEEEKGSCGECSQVMIIIDPQSINNKKFADDLIEETIKYIKSADIDDNLKEIRVPGEGSLKFHEIHNQKGIYVDDDVWSKITSL